jgi:hypothetical protein
MAQQKKLSLAEVEAYLDELTEDNKAAQEDLLRLMVLLDRFVVKHDRSDLARAIRRATRKVIR